MKGLILGILALTATACFANSGGVDTNGGDICENRFKVVRDDLKGWILNGGSVALQLPEGISIGQYNQDMLRQIGLAKISCTDDKILIGHAEKTCKNYVAEDGTIRINCNTRRFMETSESDQYVLVHHEYAGLAGFEVNSGEDSIYPISNQIAGYLEDHVVKKLVVRPNNSGADPFDPSICQGPVFSASDAARVIRPGESHGQLGTYRTYARSRKCNQLTGCNQWYTDEVQSVLAYYRTSLPHSPLLTVSLANNPSGYTVDLSQTFELQPTYVDQPVALRVAHVASGVPGKLDLSQATAEITSLSVLGPMWNFSEKGFVEGELRQSCGWFHMKIKGSVGHELTYVESEIVYYGLNN